VRSFCTSSRRPQAAATASGSAPPPSATAPARAGWAARDTTKPGTASGSAGAGHEDKGVSYVGAQLAGATNSPLGTDSAASGQGRSPGTRIASGGQDLWPWTRGSRWRPRQPRCGAPRSVRATRTVPPAARTSGPGPGDVPPAAGDTPDPGAPGCPPGPSPPAAHQRRPDHASGRKVVRPAGRSTLRPESRPGRAEPARREATTAHHRSTLANRDDDRSWEKPGRRSCWTARRMPGRTDADQGDIQDV
jgi:hypothetical protein